MKKLSFLKLTAWFSTVAVLIFLSGSILSAAPIIIDHTSIDRFSTMSDDAIHSVQSAINWHYAHTSHGGQLTTGLSRIEASDSRYDVTITSQSLPNISGTLNIFDGQETQTYISPDLYWDGSTGTLMTQNVLNHHPAINVSAWSWCTQLDSNTTDVQAYLDQMALFEAANPAVTFIYMTGNAQATGTAGYNRYLNNELIRNWVRNSENRVLFDFADLDAWWFNGSTWVQSTYDYNGMNIPVEHAQFNGNEAGHTTFESCEQKGKAVWVMMADIVGVNAVPVPGTVSLFSMGLIALMGLKRKYPH